MGKYHSSLNRVRQTNLGVEEFVWDTVNDERCREAHAERDGETYSWDDPPGDADDPAGGAARDHGFRHRLTGEEEVAQV